MNTVLNFMDKIYSDSNTLSMVYIVGAILLFAFIIMLIFSLRKPKDEPKIIEPKEDEKEPVIEERKDEIKETEEKKEQIVEPILNIEPEKEKEDIFKVLDNVQEERKEVVKEPLIEEKTDISNISANIPDVDEYVDNVVKKTYEKNEQFSSVYVGGNTSTIKLDKVLDKMNVDEDIKEEIVPEEEKSIPKEKEEKIIESIEEQNKAVNVEENIDVTVEEKTEEKVDTKISNLDALKKSLEEKKQEVNSKQDDLKNKLESLKTNKPVSNDTIKAEDLLNKLNSLKDTR